MGKITDVVRRYVPSSYRALCAITNDYYSLDLLQDLADFVQYRLYSTIVGVTNEATYNKKETELLGALTTLQFIPAAVEYWGGTESSKTASGVNESVSYFDRREDLWKIFAQLQELATELSTELGVFSKVASIPQVSYGDNGRKVLITEDPQLFPPAFRRKIGSELTEPVWSKWG